MADIDIDFDVQILGLPELEQILNKLPLNLAKNVLRDALHAGGEVFAEAMRAKCPVSAEISHLEAEPGELRNSIGVVVRIDQNLNGGYAVIGPMYDKSKYSGKNRTHSPGVYGKFVEYGTKLMAAKPFIRPAFSTAKQRAVETFALWIGGRINQIIEKQLVIKLKE